MNTDMIFYLICATAVLIMLIYYMRRKSRISSFLFGSLTGLAALVLLNKYGIYIGADLPLNTFNICGSAVLGIPFVACMIIVKYL